MLDACDEVLTLSTTIPLVPPASATVVTPRPFVAWGNPPVMSKALRHPPETVAEHPFCTATKSMSAPPPMLALKNSVIGEHEFEFPASASGPLAGELFIVDPVKPMSQSAGSVLPPVPHQYRCPGLVPVPGQLR